MHLYLFTNSKFTVSDYVKNGCISEVWCLLRVLCGEVKCSYQNNTIF